MLHKIGPMISIQLLGLSLLTGCAKPLEVGSITNIRSATGSQSVDVLEPKRAKGVPGLPEFSGDQLLEVRTYARSDGGPDAEISGASCTLTAADYSATMETPAKVRVPLYRAESSTLSVACKMPGFKKRMITVEAFDETRRSRMSNGAGGGLIGLVAVSAIDAASDNTRNTWRYPVAKILLER
jgi:hypothetical protein